MEKEKILILYHVKEREQLICDAIKNSLNERNKNIEVFVEEFYYACYNIFLFCPNIIVTIPPRDTHSSNLLTLIKLYYDCAIISMVTEGCIPNDTESINRSIGYNVYSDKLVDYFFYWGNGVANWVGQCLVEQGKVSSKERVKFFGYIPYDVEYIRKLHGNTNWKYEFDYFRRKYKKIYLFVTGFTMAEATIEDLIIESVFEDKSNVESIERFKERIKENKKFKKDYINIIIEGAKEFPEIGFVIKLHPIEMEYNRIGKTKIFQYAELSEFENIFMVKEAIPIGHIFQYTDIFFHYGSTTALEGYIYEVPTVQIEDHNSKKNPVPHEQANVESTLVVDSKMCNIVKRVHDSNIKYKKSQRNDDYLFMTMNYTKEKDYHPAEWIVDFLLGNLLVQELHPTDKRTKMCYKSKEYFLLKRHLFVVALRELLRFKINIFIEINKLFFYLIRKK